jgi:catechol 2,3-dioxygenase
MTFYNEVVGFEEAYRVVAIKGGFLSNGNTHHDIGMIESSGASGRGRPPGLNHLAFELENEVDLVDGYQRALRDDFAFDRTLDHDIAHSAYCSDPDGNACELYADVIRDWRNARTGNVTKPKPVWWPGLTEPSTERNYDPSPEIRRVDHALFHPLRTRHATLVVSDLQSSIAFYTQKVGLKVTVESANGHFALLGGTCGEHNVTLLQSTGTLPTGYHHVGFQIADEKEMDASLDRLKAEGRIDYVHIDHPLRRVIHIQDPDGLRLQFFVDRDLSARKWAQLDPQIAVHLA